MTSPMPKIGALILAAGRSQRMGRSKLTLPWLNGTVIAHVVQTLAAGGVEDVVAVTGGDRDVVELALAGLPVRLIHNPRYCEDSMMLSLQAGLRSLPESIEAFLIALGDQPQIEQNIVRRVIERNRSTGSVLVVPSFEQHRGHPWLVGHALWPDLLRRPPEHTARNFLNDHADKINYVEVDGDSILRDLDTPEDYQRELAEARLHQTE